MDDKKVLESSSENTDLSNAEQETENTEEETTSNETDETDTRLDHHPRFQKLISQKNEYKKKYEEMSERMKEIEQKLDEEEEETKEKMELSDNDHETLVKKAVKSIAEQNFLEELNIDNIYDQKKILKEARILADFLLKTNKSKTYKDALRKAYMIINEEEITETEKAKKRQPTTEKLVSYQGSSPSVDEKTVSLTQEQLRAAKRFGMTPQEYKNYL